MIKRIALVAALGLAAFAVPATATDLTATCETATFHIGDVPDNRVWAVDVDGKPFAEGEGSKTITIPLGFDDADIHEVYLRTGSYKDPRNVNAGSTRVVSVGPCGEPPVTPPPVTPPVTPPPPVDPPVEPPVVVPPPPPPPVVRTDCSYLKSVGAGQKWLKKFGCVTPLTCRDLKARGAGKNWYKKLGINYYDCHVPISVVVRHPKVTG